jgi:hypothetical protein
MAPPAHVACGVFPLRRSALSWLACVSIALAMPVLTPNPAAAAELSPKRLLGIVHRVLREGPRPNGPGDHDVPLVQRRQP